MAGGQLTLARTDISTSQVVSSPPMPVRKRQVLGEPHGAASALFDAITDEASSYVPVRLASLRAVGVSVSPEESEARYGTLDLALLRDEMGDELFGAFVRSIGRTEGVEGTDANELIERAQS